MASPAYLYGIHDPGGHHLMADAPGTVVYTIDVYSDAPVDFSAHFAQGLRAILRLNHSHHGQGTIPPNPADWQRFADACATFVTRSRAVRDITIGNEPNLKVEWGRDEPVMPEEYAACYRLVYDAIKRRSPDVQIAPAAIGPFNVESDVAWIEYFTRVLKAAGYDRVDWLNLHAYSRGYDPRSVTDNSFMGAPYGQFRNGFRAYWDFLDAVPAVLRGLPVDISEMNGNGPWPDANTGWVQAAYAEIDRHNRLPGTQKIRSGCLFRWQKHDQQWQFETKGNVHADLRAAVAHKYPAPVIAMAGAQPEPAPKPVYVPTVHKGDAAAMPDLQWDERLDQRNAKLERIVVAPGAMVYRLVGAGWYNEQESGGRHHVFVDVLDEGGRRMSGVPVRMFWPGGYESKETDTGKASDHGVDFPMFNLGPAYSVRVDEEFSDVVSGLGLGSIAAPHHSIHTSYRLVFQRTRQPAISKPTTPPPEPAQPQPEPQGTVPALVHPVKNPQFRRVSQPFGVNPERYTRFGLDGHNGVDFATPEGSETVAVDDGVAVQVGFDPPGYGRYILVRHDWGESLYAHLSEQTGVQGATVRAGQVIGLSGNTGNSTGPHLHFGLRINPYRRGRPFDGYCDPAPYLQATGEIPQSNGDVRHILREAAREFGIDEELILSQAWAESSFNPNARSAAGALGLMQIMPQTWDEWSAKVGAQDPLNARDSARVGAAYMQWLIQTLAQTYDQNATLMALIAYGWGIGNLLAGEQEPPQAWKTYAAKIMHGRDLLKAVQA